ncbi:plasmid transfer ATPase TraJ [Zooshikella marina]|uniref:plasmid transfer ATPase TraJ n=1 Tax=Zooshikella ganghwensis TaxID=202772 RepID=UPI001BAFAFD4|nr:plasmid transfer ATPase TraJ [Zooshikella ganghwensis]MBU2708702.1 plasmid transfer ATPase TraJ [Zooshikella ganghwensis]
MIDFEQFNFHGELDSGEFKRFLKYCADKNVSDILVQGGDYIWVELYGRQIKATTHTIKQAHLSNLISTFWSADVEAALGSGYGADRALEVYGEEYGIPRGEYLRFRCNFIQARVARVNEAYAITMRIIPSELPDLNKMSIEEELFHAFYPAMGIVLICGPTGSGKTTLQAGIYAYAGKHYPDRKVITYEDPIEFILGGSHWKGPQPAQSQIGRDIQTFADGIRNGMRRKPSIIGIGEARDLETMDAMVEAGLTGHLCFATVHTESVAETINRVIQVYPPAQQASVASRLMGTLRVIVVQRLLKTLDGKREAIREFVVFDRELRNELQDHSYDRWAPMLRQKLENAEKTIDDKAWLLFKEGKIDKQEFIELAGYKAFRVRDERNAK